MMLIISVSAINGFGAVVKASPAFAQLVGNLNQIPGSPLIAMNKIIRNVYSVCPICLKKFPASLERIDGKIGIYLSKNCPEHGYFSVPVWHDRVDFDSWISREAPLSKDEESSLWPLGRSLILSRENGAVMSMFITA